MEPDKYVGADVHSATTSLAVLNGRGKLLMEAVVETQAEILVSFVRSLAGRVHLTFEEGTQAEWLHELLEPHVEELVVCDPRANKRLQGEDKSDRIDAAELAERLRGGFLRPVFHGSSSTRPLKELVRGHEHLVSDSVRIQNRLKAVLRSRGVRLPQRLKTFDASGQEVFDSLADPELRMRVQWLWREYQAVESLRAEAKKALRRECRRHPACRLLKTVPGVGSIRAVQIVSQVGTPFRFRTKRQLWKYSGLAVVMSTSSDYRVGKSGLEKKVHRATRGLNRNFSRLLKAAFKGAALSASMRGDFRDYYRELVEGGQREEMARLTLARKIAAICLILWKKGEAFDSTIALGRTVSEIP